jgi:hypothetical protein
VYLVGRKRWEKNTRPTTDLKGKICELVITAYGEDPVFS